MMPRVLQYLLFSLLTVLLPGAYTSAYEDDQVLALVKGHTDGGVIWLRSGSGTFLSLYREADGDGTGRAALILPGMGMHADWPEVVSPLRRQLPGQGWTTMSVQMPMLDPGEGPAEYGGVFRDSTERIRSAMRYLRDRGYSSIIIIGQGFGATLAVNYLTTVDSSISAMVGISMQPHPFLKPKYDLVEELTKIEQPVLDIYAERDIMGVLRSTDDRRLAASKGKNRVYRQVQVRNSNRYYNGHEEELSGIVVSWLESIIGSGEQP